MQLGQDIIFEGSDNSVAVIVNIYEIKLIIYLVLFLFFRILAEELVC